MSNTPESEDKNLPSIKKLSAPEWQDPELAAKLARMTRRDRDELTYGVIELDENGVILSYNQTEADIAGRDPEEVLGRNLFFDVAPCLQSLRFYLPFQKSLAAGEGMDSEYDYVLNRTEAPKGVKVH